MNTYLSLPCFSFHVMSRCWGLMLLTFMLGGCASINTLRSEVSTFGQWPEGRPPGTYAFERLPSQALRAENQQALEDAARSAIERAGFKAAASGQSPDVFIQLGARISAAQRSPFDDPFYWHPGLYQHFRYRSARSGFYWTQAWDRSLETSQVDREVSLLIRDRSSGAVLYEARASNFGYAFASSTWLPTMFHAALSDFPRSMAATKVVAMPLVK
jgi:Domain of unknown function (DUF4136)